MRRVLGRATKAWVVDDSRARDVKTFAMVDMFTSHARQQKVGVSGGWRVAADFERETGRREMGEVESALFSVLLHALPDFSWYYYYYYYYFLNGTIHPFW